MNIISQFQYFIVKCAAPYTAGATGGNQEIAVTKRAQRKIRNKRGYNKILNRRLADVDNIQLIQTKKMLTYKSSL